MFTRINYGSDAILVLMSTYLHHTSLNDQLLSRQDTSAAAGNSTTSRNNLDVNISSSHVTQRSAVVSAGHSSSGQFDSITLDVNISSPHVTQRSAVVSAGHSSSGQFDSITLDVNISSPHVTQRSAVVSAGHSSSGQFDSITLDVNISSHTSLNDQLLSRQDTSAAAGNSTPSQADLKICRPLPIHNLPNLYRYPPPYTHHVGLVPRWVDATSAAARRPR
ncbi:hypothetical protein J6590_020087 [Homalodisca vitripennis]|nr:hypothetical protein J6590_020087 [Homalodisca vitripennis]